MINHEYKFIFLHIPKCAGTSVGQTLKEICTYGRWHAYACNGIHEEDPFNGHLVCREFGPERHFDTFVSVVLCVGEGSDSRTRPVLLKSFDAVEDGSDGLSFDSNWVLVVE